MAFHNCTELDYIYYIGTSQDWYNIFIDDHNAILSRTTVYFYAPDGAPDETGNYWRYVDGVPTPW